MSHAFVLSLAFDAKDGRHLPMLHRQRAMVAVGTPEQLVKGNHQQEPQPSDLTVTIKEQGFHNMDFAPDNMDIHTIWPWESPILWGCLREVVFPPIWVYVKLEDIMKEKK